MNLNRRLADRVLMADAEGNRVSTFPLATKVVVTVTTKLANTERTSRRRCCRCRRRRREDEGEDEEEGGMWRVDGEGG